MIKVNSVSPEVIPLNKYKPTEHPRVFIDKQDDVLCIVCYENALEIDLKGIHPEL